MIRRRTKYLAQPVPGGFVVRDPFRGGSHALFWAKALLLMPFGYFGLQEMTEDLVLTDADGIELYRFGPLRQSRAGSAMREITVAVEANGLDGFLAKYAEDRDPPWGRHRDAGIVNTLDQEVTGLGLGVRSFFWRRRPE